MIFTGFFFETIVYIPFTVLILICSGVEMSTCEAYPSYFLSAIHVLSSFFFSLSFLPKASWFRLFARMGKMSLLQVSQPS